MILAALKTQNIVFSTISVTTSFFAASLTMLRSSYYAMGYAANDIVLIVLWVLASISNPRYLSVTIIFGIFFFYDIYGFISWKKRENDIKTPEQWELQSAEWSVNYKIIKLESRIMFRAIRKKKNELDKNDAENILQYSRRGVLAVNGDDGYPYAIPINYIYDKDVQKIYFHGARVGHKVDALKVCDKVFMEMKSSRKKHGHHLCRVQLCLADVI
jgi:hypothetical protein